jgi:hypothetical protein
MCNDPLIKHPLWLMDVDFDCESELTFENGILVPLTKFERFCVVSFLVCLPLGRPLGWPAGVSSILSMGEQPPRSGKPGDFIKSYPCAAVLLGRLPSDETPGVSSLGCALVAVRACLWVLLCCVHPITFLTPYLPYPTVIPSVRYTSSTLSCF